MQIPYYILFYYLPFYQFVFFTSSAPVAILVRNVLPISILNLHMAHLHLYNWFLCFLTTTSFSLNSYFLSVTPLWTERLLCPKDATFSYFSSQDAEPFPVSLHHFHLSSSLLNKGAPQRIWNSRWGLKNSNSYPSFYMQLPSWPELSSLSVSQQ